MQKTTVVIPEYLHERLKQAASARHESMGAVIRRAIEKEVSEVWPKPKSLGIFDSGHTDTGARAGEIKYEPRSWRSS